MHFLPRLLRDLRGQGWATAQLEGDDSVSLESQLLQLAAKLGRPQATRGKALVDRLMPKASEDAHPKSLSASTGLAQQPWHTDLAHCQIPARYIVLACEVEGSSAVPTELVHSRGLLSPSDYEAARTEPFLVRNGRKSFYATLLAPGHRFLRFDPGCMQPMTKGAKALMRNLCSKNIAPDFRAAWRPGLVIAIENSWMLHRRVDAHAAQDRVLMRVSVMGDIVR
jgi:alpha-ketoglutarate-dependent taurine dioxygenase